MNQVHLGQQSAITVTVLLHTTVSLISESSSDDSPQNPSPLLLVMRHDSRMLPRVHDRDRGDIWDGNKNEDFVAGTETAPRRVVSVRGVRFSVAKRRFL